MGSDNINRFPLHINLFAGFQAAHPRRSLDGDRAGFSGPPFLCVLKT